MPNKLMAMRSFRDTHHRYSLALTAVLAIALGVLLAVLGTADDADGRGAAPIGNGEGAVDLVQVGGDFNQPVNIAFAPGESDKVYVVEQGGLVRVIAGGVTQAEPFLDATQVTKATGEQGLLGLAFHPGFEANGFVYAYYTDQANGDVVVSEYEASSGLDADESSRRQVIRIRHRDYSNHNGGQVLFGPDGFMYLATGDGGGAGDPVENAQNKRSLLGKLLRINPLDPPGARSYRTPSGNPFKGRKGRDEIYARGLRNPFRFTFDSKNGRIAIGDVGQDRFEEVNYETRKSLRNANFGWDRFEGRKRFDNPFDNEASTPKAKNHDKPIFTYGKGGCGGACSVIGGLVVRDPSLVNLYGRYLFADAFKAKLRSFVPKLRRAEDARYLSQPAVGFPTSFTADPETNEVYMTSRTGAVYRLEPPA